MGLQLGEFTSHVLRIDELRSLPENLELTLPPIFASCSLTFRLDIMAATSQQLDLGYQKIFRWIQFEFRQFVREAQLEVGVVLREAVKRLRDRKSLLTFVSTTPPSSLPNSTQLTLN